MMTASNLYRANRQFAADNHLIQAQSDATSNGSPLHRLIKSTDSANDIFSRRSSVTRLLVVDDDDVDRERITRFIRKFNIPLDIINAQNGREAINQLSQHAIDLILLDYQLGDMTGTEVLNEIRRHDHKIPTIMVTGMGDEATAVEAMRLGVFDYLPKKSMTAETLFSVLASALHAAMLERELEETQAHLRRISLFDSMTGLPNRNLFFDRLSQAIHSAERSNGTFSLLMIDLNLFKEINDSLGHSAGDTVLTTIGDRLHTIARKSDTMARIGGDEFAAILHSVANPESACTCLEKLIATISQPIIIDGQVVKVGASIGIAHYPDHGRDQSTLLSNADHAMYTAKRNHRSYEFYKPQDTHDSTRAIPVTQHLHRAMQRQELFLEFQPKVALGCPKPVGAEVLVRWNNPECGLVMPSEFITAAERSSLIEELTYHIVEMSLEQFVNLRNLGYELPLAINISARMLDKHSLPRWLEQKLNHYQISAKHITLEITETTLASSSSTAYKVLEDLDTLGFAISIDDFGSGFTSFSAISNCHIAELKIDRQYINKMTNSEKDHAILRSMLLMADSLKIHTVAEGVETAEQYQLLIEQGCKSAQGYYIARPMTVDKLIKWLKNHGNPPPQ